jgi:hypothetical protein
MLVVPAERAETTPVALTVAMVVFEEIHGLTKAGLGEPVSAEVALTHAESVPEIVGSAFTRTEMLSVPIQPLLSVTVYVSV